MIRLKINGMISDEGALADERHIKIMNINVFCFGMVGKSQQYHALVPSKSKNNMLY
jgi:hypothetical protein